MSGGDSDWKSSPEAKIIPERWRRVPEIGSLWRWYDIPYRLAGLLLRSYFGRRLPWRVRRAAVDVQNFLISFNEYEREKVAPASDPDQSLQSPEGESFVIGGLWVTELFPPSEAEALVRQIKRNGWARNHFYNWGVDPADRVARDRTLASSGWSLLADFKRATRPDAWPLGRPEALPDCFDYARVFTTNIGGSLTAVTAYFEITEEYSREAYRECFRAQNPAIRWNGSQRPRVLGRRFVTYEKVWERRESLHAHAREWLARHCRGYFANCGSKAPVVDVILFEEFDPLLESSPTPRDMLRGLNVDYMIGLSVFTKTEPQLVLAEAGRPGREWRPDPSTWCMMGNGERVSRKVAWRFGRDYTPGNLETCRALDHDEVRAVIIHLTCRAYLMTMQAHLNQRRDQALRMGGRIDADALDALRLEVLTTGFDIRTSVQDAANVWKVGANAHGPVILGVMDTFPDSAGCPPDIPGYWRKDVEETCANLVQGEDAYRQALSTAASLGAAAESARLGLKALLVSFASLFVAGVTLLTATANNNSLGSHIWKWLVALCT